MDSERRIWLDTEESEEARAFFGNPYMILSLGDRLLPEAIPLDRAYRVLDIGCGAGEWAFGVVQQYPLAHVHGIDTSNALIGRAMRHASQKGLERVSFQLFDAAQPLTFPDETFDIVHVQSLASFIMTAMRDRIIDEMLRVLKVGGWLNIIDFEQGSTSSAAYNRLSIMGLKGVGSLGGTLIPSSSNYGVAARLYGFLIEAGLIDVSYTLHAVDYGVNSHPQTRQFLNDLVVGMRNFKPFLLMLELTSSQAFDDLVEQAIDELYRPDACGYAYLISAIGRKDF